MTQVFLDVAALDEDSVVREQLGYFVSAALEVSEDFIAKLDCV